LFKIVTFLNKIVCKYTFLDIKDYKIPYLYIIKPALAKIIVMKTNDIFNLLHNAVESKFMGKKISQREMADKLGVSMRTYQDWRLGNSNPQAAVAIFKMLGELDADDTLRLIKRIATDIKDEK